MKILKMQVPGTVNNGDVVLKADECKMLCNYESYLRGRLNLRPISGEYDAMLSKILSAYFDSISRILPVYYCAYFPGDAGSDFYHLIYGSHDSVMKLRMLYETTGGLWKWGDEYIADGQFSQAGSWTEDGSSLTVIEGIAKVIDSGSGHGHIEQEIEVEAGDVFELLFQHRSNSTAEYSVEQFRYPNWTFISGMENVALSGSSFGAFTRVSITADTEMSKLRVSLQVKFANQTADFQNVMLIKDWLCDLGNVINFTGSSELRAVQDRNRIFIADNVNYPIFIEYDKKGEVNYGRLGYPAPWAKPSIDVNGYEEEYYDDSQEGEFMGEPGLVQLSYCYKDKKGKRSNPSPVSIAGDMQFFKIWTDVDGTQINRIKQIKCSGLELPSSLPDIVKEDIDLFEIHLRITLYSEGIEARVMGLVREFDIQDKDGKTHVSTIHLLYDSYKFVRKATLKDKEKLVNGKISKITI